MTRLIPVLMLLSGLAQADSTGSTLTFWAQAQPVVVVSVTRVGTSARFEVSVDVHDRASGVVLPRQHVETTAGTEASVGFGSQQYLIVKVSCLVHEDGETALCRTDFTRGDGSTLAQEAVLAVIREA
jgi:hypothetical protein